MMEKISQGEWTASTLVVKNAETGIVKKHTHINCDGVPIDMSGDVGVANGRLMATAPAMLLRLVELRDWIPQWMEGTEVESVLADIDAVIAKATEVTL